LIKIANAIKVDRIRFGFVSAIFIAASALFWLLCNNMSSSAPEGYDPLRYQYYALYGLPGWAEDSSSYRIVGLLQEIYKIFPGYLGFLLFIWIICQGIFRYDRKQIALVVMFSPISFYYLAQTGKDGIAVLAMGAIAQLAARKPNFGSLLICGAVVLLAIYLRPAITLLLPIVVVQFMYGNRAAYFILPILAFFVYYFNNLGELQYILQATAGDEGSGTMIRIIREYTLGYDAGKTILKILLFGLSFIFQPGLSIVKFYSSGVESPLFQSLCLTLFLYFMVKEKIIKEFFIASVPYVIVLGISVPFYHFRYLEACYPVIYAFCLAKRPAGRPKLTRLP
jgi:hypothetical protein